MKKIVETLAQKWAEYLIEATVIVASILGAFALDNWNEERRNKKITKNLLIQFQLELENNINFLEKRIELQNEPLFIQLDSVINGYYTEQSSAKIIRAVYQYPTSVPTMPILNEILNAETIKENNEILSVARELNQQIQFIQNGERFLDEFYNIEVSPYFNSNGLALIMYNTKGASTHNLVLSNEQKKVVTSDFIKNLAASKSLLVKFWLNRQKDALKNSIELKQIVDKKLIVK